MDQKSSRCDAHLQMDRLDESDELHRKNDENINRITYLSKTLEQKDDLIKLLLKEKSILDCEKDLLQKEQLSAVREKECIVMRFAIVEKSLIDLKSQLEQSEKREKKILKDCDTLNNKLKAAKDEKMRITATFDLKCQEHINSLKYIETLKTEISSLETKCRWNTAKLRKEIECKNTLEKELQQFQKNLENNQKPESDECSLNKIAELKASQIMLIHVNTEQTERIHYLEKELENVSKELKATKIQLADCNHEQSGMCAENNKLHQENLDLQNLVDTNVIKIAELQAKVNDLEALRAQLSISKNANCNLTEHLQYVQKQLTELTDDIAKFQKRESELLALNQELGSLNAKLQNDISLYGSKSLATSLENNKANKTQYECRINKLQEELDSERKDRFEERLVMARHFAEKSKECDNLQQTLDKALEDLTVMKKKHAMLIKDLQREIALLQKSSALQQINKTQKIENIKSSVSENCLDYVDIYEEKEPPTSKLIERIVRLQQANNRQAEKIDFLENHSSTLVVELQKKTKIITHYMIKEHSSTIVSGEKNKLYNGIINAVYGNAKTSEMSLELVLEVNKKLQLVLEDTLLKNITLKDNLDTLGLEVDRLTRQIATCKRGNR